MRWQSTKKCHELNENRWICRWFRCVFCTRQTLFGIDSSRTLDDLIEVIRKMANANIANANCNDAPQVYIVFFTFSWRNLFACISLITAKYFPEEFSQTHEYTYERARNWLWVYIFALSDGRFTTDYWMPTLNSAEENNKICVGYEWSCESCTFASYLWLPNACVLTINIFRILRAHTYSHSHTTMSK